MLPLKHLNDSFGPLEQEIINIGGGQTLILCPIFRFLMIFWGANERSGHAIFKTVRHVEFGPLLFKL